jgi:DNA-binding transcriptional LysR family regulator
MVAFGEPFTLNLGPRWRTCGTASLLSTRSSSHAELILWNLAPKPLWMIQAVWSLDRTPTRGRAVLCEPFHAAFPSVPLPLSVEALGAVIALVLDGRCAFAVAGSVPTLPPSLALEPLRSAGMGMVASPLHLLASYGGPIPSEVLAEYVQLVFTDRTTLSKDREFGVLSSKT